MRILGIDPGLNTTGYAVLEINRGTDFSPSSRSTDFSTSPNDVRLGPLPGNELNSVLRHNAPPRLVEAGVVRGKSRGSLADRLAEIHAGVVDIIDSLKPTVLAIEELYTHYDRPTTAILMGHARGVIILAATEAGIPVEHYAATQIKKTLTGNGRAAKWQIQEAIRRELNLPSAPEPPDVADALAIALCHCYLGVRIQRVGKSE
jgi:crossover junction endodeoxyribonuclease RuvC